MRTPLLTTSEKMSNLQTPPFQGGEYAVPYIRHRNYEPLYLVCNPQPPIRSRQQRCAIPDSDIRDAGLSVMAVAYLCWRLRIGECGLATWGELCNQPECI